MHCPSLISKVNTSYSWNILSWFLCIANNGECDVVILFPIVIFLAEVQATRWCRVGGFSIPSQTIRERPLFNLEASPQFKWKIITFDKNYCADDCLSNDPPNAKEESYKQVIFKLAKEEHKTEGTNKKSSKIFIHIFLLKVRKKWEIGNKCFPSGLHSLDLRDPFAVSSTGGSTNPPNPPIHQIHQIHQSTNSTDPTNSTNPDWTIPHHGVTYHTKPCQTF